MKTENDILEFLKENYSDCVRSIKFISKDDGNNVYMIDKENIKFFDFDEKILKKIYPSEITLAGVDGIDIKNETLYFIEFKNGSLKKEKKGIRLKASESLIGILKSFEKFSYDCDFINLCSLNKKFILVYNEEKNEVNANEARLRDVCSCEDLQEQLKQYEGNLYNKIYILSKKKFENIYLKKYYQEEIDTPT